MPTKAYAVRSATAPFAPFSIERRAPGPKDVAIDILFCGVCHSDLHTARSEWPGTRYPCVPGHEIVGRVTAVGAEVTSFKAGDLAAVGCMVDSCRRCLSCDDGLEQYCEHGFVATYNGALDGSGENTYGGYSTAIVVDEHFVLAIRHEEAQLAAVAPLLCAGITTWSPLKHWGVGPGKKVGVVGIGGLGHMGVKLAHALGAHVVAFTTSPSKREAALALGADEVVVSKDAEAMAARAGSLDFILDTVAVSHDLDAYVTLLKRDGVLTLVGVPETPHPSPSAGGLIFKRRQIAGSLIGGIKETQEMLDFCAEKGIVADIETIAMQEIETAYARMVKSDVKYRFVIDMASLKAA
ncbi:NAD(P)-dependent alcohol dehydrogenase [Methylosinus sporium]|uniref:Hydroxyacid dehydrogenase n=1 Tax=Methylosinus sporium TaxID=428 RepID=A0A2U1SSH0_METSR|nr:NAD(P)-dependent alcohol dehydrogenase [Methylosinus sporium]PWB94564.1 hydroxyacid dehydrogenase [Methylosinus sporium]